MAAQLLIFSKYPQPGQVKTRLIPALGELGATQLYEKLLKNTLTVAETLVDVEIQLCYGSGSLEQWQQYLDHRYSLVAQIGHDLGERLAHAVVMACQQNTPVLVIGCDCPALSTKILQTAFEALQQADLVLGPARDGGYYAIGMNQSYPELFQGIAWSTATVLPTTVAIAHKLGLRIAYLETLQDIDRPEDLALIDPNWLNSMIG